MLVEARMTTNVVTVDPDETLASADAKMRTRGFRRVPVIRDGELVGVLSGYDLREMRDKLDVTRVREAMTQNPVTISPRATVETAARTMTERSIGALPVLDHGRLIGILTAGDLLFPEPKPLQEWVPRQR
jgi:acetoin utilization protein AcuB